MKTTKPRFLCVEPVDDLPVLWATLLASGPTGHAGPPLPHSPPLERTPHPRRGSGRLAPLPRLRGRPLPQPRPALGRPTSRHPLRPPGSSTFCPRTSMTTASLTASPASAPVTAFSALERDLNQQTVRVYQLATDLVRIDTTTANSYAAVLSEQGLLQFGHSKDDPNQPQFKIAAAILDPLGLPLATAVVPGNAADDPCISRPSGRCNKRSAWAVVPTWETPKWALWPLVLSWPRGATSTCAPCRRRSSVRPSGASYCGRCGRAPRRCSRCRAGSGGTVRRVGSGGVCRGCAVDGVGPGEGSAVDGAALAGAFPGIRPSPRGGVGTPAGEGHSGLGGVAHGAKQGKKPLGHAELVHAAVTLVTREGVTGLLCCRVQAVQTARSKRAYGGSPGRGRRWRYRWGSKCNGTKR